MVAKTCSYIRTVTWASCKTQVYLNIPFDSLFIVLVESFNQGAIHDEKKTHALKLTLFQMFDMTAVLLNVLLD